MPRIIKSPSVIKAAGNTPKIIQEFVGRVNSREHSVSIARMKSPVGWEEPGQKPEFTEYTLVLSGSVRIRSAEGIVDVRAGEVVITQPGEWVQYSTPEAPGAEYIAVCVPAFSVETVHRDGTG